MRNGGQNRRVCIVKSSGANKKCENLFFKIAFIFFSDFCNKNSSEKGKNMRMNLTVHHHIKNNFFTCYLNIPQNLLFQFQFLFSIEPEDTLECDIASFE